ncbi:MAG: hypothetical protein CBB72_011630 [Muricauda sp. TMED12]|nr:MAG: hypothetical protein CBB72_011630 [Muricauda sp. TMED12]
MNYRSTIETMDPYDAYKLYQAMKLHFESDSYDAIKYNYKTSAKPQAFFKRRDKYYFAKLAKKYPKTEQLTEFYVSNFVNDAKWVGDMNEEIGEKNYNQWLKSSQSLSYIFERDIYKLHAWCTSEQSTFDDVLIVRDNQHPLVCTMYARGDIDIVTVVILDQLTGFLNQANCNIKETLVWPDLYRKLKKTQPFVRVNLEKMKKTVVSIFEN